MQCIMVDQVTIEILDMINIPICVIGLKTLSKFLRKNERLE